MPVNKKSLTWPLAADKQSFFLESEVRLSGVGVWSSLLGICVLLTLKFLLPAGSGNTPSLGVLMAVGIAIAVFYLGTRFIAFGMIRAKVKQQYSVKNPRAGFPRRGELPRNCFLLALVIPTGLLIPLCCGVLAAGIGLGPELWIVISVGAALCLRDLMGVVHVLFVDPARWIKETPIGFDVLEPVGEL